MSGKGLRLTATVLRFSLRYWQAGSGQAVLAMAREARITASVMARDGVRNAEARVILAAAGRDHASK